MFLQADTVAGVYEVEDFCTKCTVYLTTTDFLRRLPNVQNGEIVGVVVEDTTAIEKDYHIKYLWKVK